MRGMDQEPCPEHLDALDRALESGSMDADLERHLASCPACRRYHRKLRGLESFLREGIEGFEHMEPGSLRETRRPVASRIAAVAALVVIVGGLSAWGVSALRRGGPAGDGPDSTHLATTAPEPDPGRVVLASGPWSMVARPDGAETLLDVGSRIETGSEVRVSEGGSLIVDFSSGITLLAGPASRFRLSEATADAHVVWVYEGIVTVSSDRADANHRVAILSEGPRVEPAGRVVAVMAERGSIVAVSSLRGRARVHRPEGGTDTLEEGERLHLSSGERGAVGPVATGVTASLDLISRDGYRSALSVLADVPSSVSVDGCPMGHVPVTVLLAEGTYDVRVTNAEGNVLHEEAVEVVYGREAEIVVEGVVVEPVTVPATPPPEPVAEHPGEPPTPDETTAQVDIVALVRQALAAGDTSEALALVTKHHGKHAGDPAFLTLAGDTYRRLGRWDDAIGEYLAAAHHGSGTTAEKAYLAAARIALDKLGDTARTQTIVSAYWDDFPAGYFRLEASFLHARLLVRQKKYVQARDKLEAMLATNPKSYMATKARLLLGSILVTHLDDCASAVPHLEAVEKQAPGGKLAEEARRYLDRCDAG